MVIYAFHTDRVSTHQCDTFPMQTGAHLCSNMLQQAALLHVRNTCGTGIMPPSVRTV